jgi:hypothetical protein
MYKPVDYEFFTIFLSQKYELIEQDYTAEQ